MRIGAITVLTLVSFCGTFDAASAQQPNSCQICRDQQRACMKNYPVPTCKTEYQMCMKSCGKK
jgi:hypothetical protein